MNQLTFIKSIENDKFAICAKINYFSITKLFERFVVFVARVYFDILNVFFVKYVFHRSLSCFCKNFTKKYLIKFKFIKNKLAKVLEKALFVASIDGFSTNLLNINSGIMTANAGDSAQFLFVARAILAGFNASNVDVRSSRYDAIVDFENTLLRIQIKGISSGEIISFKDRDRGGQGIDYTHERNRGKRITKADCDIYVAVDKQVGICYLIPMSFADTLSDDECSKVKLEQVQDFKENWDIIKEVARASKK